MRAGRDQRSDGARPWWAAVGDPISTVVLHPNSRAAIDALLALRVAVLVIVAVLLAFVGSLWTEVRGSYLIISGSMCAWLFLVTVLLAVVRHSRSQRWLTGAILASFVSDIIVELVILGAADTTRSAIMLFPLLTVVSAALIGGTRTGVICLITLGVGYPVAILFGIQGHFEGLSPPYETIETVPQVLYHTVSQMALVAGVLAIFVYVIQRLRSLTQVYNDELQLARRQIEADARRRAEEQHLVRMGRMTSFLAHELRNPLTAILTSAELIEMDMDEPALVRESTSEIKDQTLRLSRMLTDVLDYTREFTPVARNHDLFPFLEDQVAGGHPGIDVEWDGPLSLPVFVDPDHARQVLENLIRNAMQAAGSGGRVHIRGELLGMEWVAVEIHDDGPGVPEPDRERIFEAFYTTKPKGEGTGLGLAICRRLCWLNGMQIEVVGSDLGGAAFQVIFPAAQAGAPLETHSRPSVEDGERSRGRPARMPTVLVVEDEERLRNNIQRTVSREGYTVVTAADLTEAREAVVEHHPQVILLDLALGNEDGATLLSELPNDDDRPVVLVTSAYSDVARREQLRSLGAAGYLVKPIRRKTLLGAIREHLEGSNEG